MAQSRAALPILLLLCLLLAACGGSGSPSAEPSEASEAPSVAASAEASVEPSTAPSAEPSAAADAPRQFGMNVPVTLTVPASWSREDWSTQAQLVLHVVADRWLVFSTLGPDTVDEWVTKLTTTPQLTVVAEPQPTEIGGASGYVVDVTTSGEATNVGCGEASIICYSLFEDEAGPWIVVEGTTTRAWVVDVDGETVIIVTDARTSGFEAWVQQMEEVLATAEWGS